MDDLTSHPSKIFIFNYLNNFYHKKYQNNMGVIRNIPLKNQAYISEEVSFPTLQRTILYQGVLNPGRGIKPMIEALQYLENLDLIIIGYGKVEAELKQFVKDKKMENRVFFLGRISREKLLNYTQKATLGMVLEEPLTKKDFYLKNVIQRFRLHSKSQFNLTPICQLKR